ncbi:MAG: ubiquitin-conjugating enzyme family protein [Candidatus Odinarchaeota archaeon]
MLEEEAFYRRLAVEAQQLELEEPTFHSVKGDVTAWRGVILGTGIYDNGVFYIDIELKRTYPFEPPRVLFKTPIWHPNIGLDGRVCVGILGKDWRPGINLVGVIETIRNLLNFPNPKDPLNRVAAEQMMLKPSEFEKTVREYVSKYATWNQKIS